MDAFDQKIGAGGKTTRFGESGARLRLEQRRAGFSNHHRIEHHRRARLQRVERPHDGLDRLERPKHPDLDRVDPNVVADRAHLFDDQLRRDRR